MEAIAPIGFAVLGLLLGGAYFVTCHALSVVARKTDQGDVAEILAYVPILQIAPMVWAGGGSLVRFLVFSVALLGANVLLGFAAVKAGGEEGSALATAMQLGASSLLMIASSIYFTLLGWRTADRRGLPGWIALMMWVPLLSFFLYPILAFHDGWARPHKVGAVIAVLFTVGITAPMVMLARDPEILAAAMASAEVERAASLEDVGSLDAMPVVPVAGDPGQPGGQPAAMPAPVAQDHDASIRALLALQGGFETLDARAAPQNLRTPANRTRVLAMVRGLRNELEQSRDALDAETYQELANHLVRTEARIRDRARPSKAGSAGSIRLADTPIATRAETTGPAAPDPSAAGGGAPTRPFPVQVTEDCPVGTELRTRARDDGEEEWCQQLAAAGGLRHGWYARYRADGKPEQVGEYRNGLRVGVWTRFHPGGEVRAQAEFEGGLQHGWLLSFAQSGELKRAARFERGAAVR